MSSGKDLQLGEMSVAVWGKGVVLREVMGCQGGSAETATAGQVPVLPHVLSAGFWCVV